MKSKFFTIVLDSPRLLTTIFISPKKFQSHRNDFLETVRYQILVPIQEIQVRAIKNKADLLGNKGNEAGDEGKDANVFYWELIQLKCSLINTNIQKRTEKVFQLYSRWVLFWS